MSCVVLSFPPKFNQMHIWTPSGFDVQDLNAANSTGFMIAQMTSKNGVRVSSARAFLRPAQNRPNLHIMLNTTVAKVLINPRSKNAYGVEIVDAFGHTMKVAAKKEVIVAGGAVNSPQILMLSGIGPKEELTRVSWLARRGQNGNFVNFLVLGNFH